ncbi:MAG: excinuclease ABC subunit A, excinuclease ABC subunit A, partial [Candidatus Woesebacteria bacterium GW2011_GWC1_42_9]
YAEGQRRYVESLSTYARQFLGIMSKPDVDAIEGLSPAISIDQKTVSKNPRSTVGTVTEIYDYLRLLFARVGHPHCPICGREISSQSLDQIVEGALALIETTAKRNKIARFLILSPIIKDRKGAFESLFKNLRAKGFRKVRIDGVIKNLDEEFVLIKTNKHTIDVIIDRISFSGELALRSRLSDSIEQALNLSDGLVIMSQVLDSGFDMPEFPRELKDNLYSEHFACPVDNIQLPEIEPRTFSFNSPHGACPRCTGLGRILKIDPNRILAPKLSVKEGGFIPYATIFEHDTWFSRLILVVCREHKIDPTQPLESLAKSDLETLLNGTGKMIYRVDGTNKQGRLTYIHWKFAGIIGELERRYQETESDYIRSSIERYMIEEECEVCLGARLKPEALSITIGGLSINQVAEMTVVECKNWVNTIQKDPKILNSKETEISNLILKEIKTRLQFLEDVGLDYLTISRTAATLAGGESQRIRLASQIGSGLSGVLYVLDEPTIGLHPRDSKRLIGTLEKIKEYGNSVIVVEHDKDVIQSADYVFDFGPGAGKHGGNVISRGTVSEIKRDTNSITGRYLSGKKKIAFRKNGVHKSEQFLSLKGASQFNLKNINVNIPLGKLVVVTGVSGSGKSTLVVETIYHALAKEINKYHKVTPGKFKEMSGYENIKKIVLIDQSPIGRTPRSNPATYTKVFDYIREVFTQTREARTLGYKKGRFSFNVKGGRCEACEGQGKTKIEMQFMPDIWVDCEVCKGLRYNNQTLEVVYKGKTIADILALTVEDAIEFFHVYSPIVHRLETLKEVGLEYMELGQSATTLSGGEAQRVKLASELSKKGTGDTMYILDEPTTGLHFADLEKLLKVLKVLVERGNSVVVIEHNLDVIRNSDWIIDLGPEGGDRGGQIVAEGTLNEIIKAKNSFTGKFLRGHNP